MVDAGSEPTYAEKIRVPPPPPWANTADPGPVTLGLIQLTLDLLPLGTLSSFLIVNSISTGKKFWKLEKNPGQGSFSAREI